MSALVEGIVALRWILVAIALVVLIGLLIDQWLRRRIAEQEADQAWACADELADEVEDLRADKKALAWQARVLGIAVQARRPVEPQRRGQLVVLPPLTEAGGQG